MKTEIRIYSLLSFLLISILVKSQSTSFGITLNPGLSKVTSDLPISGNEVKLAFSWNAGLLYELGVFKNSSVGIELLWVQIEGKEESTRSLYVITGINEFEVIGTISDESKLHSRYIGIPVYFKYRFGKFAIKPGFQTMVFLFAKAHTKNWGERNGEPFSNEHTREDIQFDTFDYGPKLGIEFMLTNSVLLRSDCYYGLTNITPDGFPWQRSNRQITLGVNYIFGANKEKE
jgi:hypothetical protein